MGYIVHKHWMEIPNCFANTYLDAFQIMPNHIHGIIVMVRSRYHNHAVSDSEFIVRGGGSQYGVVVEARPGLISTTQSIPQSTPKNIQMADISPKSGSLSVIIGGWKSKCTKEFKAIGCTWQGWQSRFHDRIIRHDMELQRIQQYICDNPKNWNSDRNFTERNL